MNQSDCDVNIADCIKNKSMNMVAMPYYKCHKQVHAIPLTRGVYNKVRGWDIPENEDPDDDGYLVVYNRGTADEYVSWSPKHVFDDGYSFNDSELDSGSTEPPFIQRMRAEYSELVERGDNLSGFTNSQKFFELDMDMRQAMCEQLHAMTKYRNALKHRFSLLGIEV
jgi:hypothetical protein